MITMMKLAFHPVNTHWLRATLYTLILAEESDLPSSGSSIKHAIPQRYSPFIMSFLTLFINRYSTK